MSRKLAMADIETTAIEYDKGGCMKIPPKVHMLVVEDYHTGKIDAFVGHDEIKNKGIPYLEETDTVVFHNGIGFDLPVLEHHFGLKRRDDWHFIDSLVLCQLFYSNVKEEEDFKRFEAHKKRPDTDPFKFTGDLIGKHGLEAWGLRLVNPKKKGEYATIAKNNGIDPWAEYNKFMHEYAVQDVVTLSAIWKERLDARFHDKKNQQAIAIEHYMAELMEQVKRSGIKVDRAHAEKLCAELEAERDKVLEVIQAEFPPRLEPKKWVYHEIPWGMPALSEEAEIEYKAKCRSSDPEHIARVNQLLSEAGPKQEFTMLMYEHPDNNIYRPRRNLPGNYLREWWGEVSVPKNNRKVTSRKTGEILYHTSKGDPFVKVEMTPFNPASRPQIARRLMELGWVPEEFTDTGNPSVSEVELNKIDEQFPAAKSIVKFLLIQKRLGQIKTGEKAWLNLLDDDDFIHPTIRACNTVAFRATHSDPNISQVPSVKTKDVVDEHGNKVKDENGKGVQRVLKGEEGKWGWDCRACFTVPEGFVMVGSDLAGIEMRAWAHYLAPFDNGYFAHVVLEKDVHEENRVILGFDDRRKAKEWLYAAMYGAGDLKLGFIIDPLASIDKQKRLGAESRARFMRGMLGYEQLNDQLMLGVRRGWLKGLDGRRIPVRKSHAALNALLQGAGAIISKYWIVFLLDIIENEYGLKYGYENDFTILLYSHDEIQIATRPEHAAKIKDAFARGARKAGEHLDFRMPVDVGIDQGAHWGDTH
ncbi:MAG: DNA polymerase [Hyphomicrobiaceae bacterium]